MRWSPLTLIALVAQLAFGAALADPLPVARVVVDEACTWSWAGDAGLLSGEGLYLASAGVRCLEGVCEQIILPEDASPPQLTVGEPHVEIAAAALEGEALDVISLCGVSWRDNCGAPAEIGVRVVAVESSDVAEQIEAREGRFVSSQVRAEGLRLTVEGAAARTYTLTLAATDPALNREEARCEVVITAP